MITTLPADTKCFVTGKPAKSWGLWGRSFWFPSPSPCLMLLLMMTMKNNTIVCACYLQMCEIQTICASCCCLEYSCRHMHSDQQTFNINCIGEMV
jgi:hypothetical protein